MQPDNKHHPFKLYHLFQNIVSKQTLNLNNYFTNKAQQDCHLYFLGKQTRRDTRASFFFIFFIYLPIEVIAEEQGLAAL